MKKLGASCPIAICNGDLLFLDIISKECKDIDILGINCYRGESFGDLFSRVKMNMASLYYLLNLVQMHIMQ